MQSTPPKIITLGDISAARAAALRPDPDLTVSEWADEHRVLSSVSAGEPGRWRTSRTPYLREIMDAASPSSPFERVVFLKGAQLGGTEVLLNLLGFIVHYSPGPTILVQPTLELAERFSKQRLASLIENSPVLRDRVSNPRSRDSGNTVRAKDFPGGTLILAGANSGVSLRSMPARFVLLDEVDGYPATSAGASAEASEGDPADLAVARSSTFANRKIVMVSTPTIEGASRIDAAYREGDQRRYYVPCPRCGHFQILVWSGVRWPDGKPAGAYYQCARCGAHLTDGDKHGMLAAGEWRAEATGDGLTASFRLSGLNSPWTSWATMAKDFLRAKKSPERLQAWTNTVLAECWQQAGAVRTPAHELLARRESYDVSDGLPPEVCVITAGVDVQADRLEIEIVGWGLHEESWSLLYSILPGDTAQPDVWEMLDQVIQATLDHPCGLQLNVAAACVDAGFQQSVVTQFCLDKGPRRVYATKGAAGQHPIWPRMHTKGKNRHPLYVVGVDGAKEAVYARLKIAEPGPGYMHFPAHEPYDLSHFEQLTSETCRVRYHKGFAQRSWEKPAGVRNEALDVRCYAYAALQSLVANGFRLNKQAAMIAGRSPQVTPQARAPQRRGEPAARYVGDIEVSNWLNRR